MERRLVAPAVGEPGAEEQAPPLAGRARVPELAEGRFAAARDVVQIDEDGRDALAALGEEGGGGALRPGRPAGGGGYGLDGAAKPARSRRLLPTDKQARCGCEPDRQADQRRRDAAGRIEEASVGRSGRRSVCRGRATRSLSIHRSRAPAQPASPTEAEPARPRASVWLAARPANSGPEDLGLMYTGFHPWIAGASELHRSRSVVRSARGNGRAAPQTKSKSKNKNQK